MGVMTCSRGDCENIMCDLYSDTYGYLCNECHEELLGKVVPIKKFMLSLKVDNDPTELEFHQKRVDALFRPNWEE